MLTTPTVIISFAKLIIFTASDITQITFIMNNFTDCLI